MISNSIKNTEETENVFELFTLGCTQRLLKLLQGTVWLIAE